MAEVLYEVVAPVCPTCGKRAQFGRPAKISMKPIAIVIDDTRADDDLRGMFEVVCGCGWVGVGYRAVSRPGIGGLF